MEGEGAKTNCGGGDEGISCKTGVRMTGSGIKFNGVQYSGCAKTHKSSMRHGSSTHALQMYL